MHFSDIDIIGTYDNSRCTTSQQLYTFLQTPRFVLFEFEEPSGKGYMYNIATNGETAQWRNPHSSGKVEVTASSISPVSLYSHIDHVVKFDTPGSFGTSYDLNIQDEPHWVVIDLKNNAPICPTHYMLNCARTCSGFELRNWLFQGSNNNVYWTTLREHVYDLTMVYDGTPYSWSIDNCKQFYRYFRIYAIGRQHNKTYNMVAIGGFEIYGKVRL